VTFELFSKVDDKTGRAGDVETEKHVMREVLDDLDWNSECVSLDLNCAVDGSKCLSDSIHVFERYGLFCVPFQVQSFSSGFGNRCDCGSGVEERSNRLSIEIDVEEDEVKRCEVCV